MGKGFLRRWVIFRLVQVGNSLPFSFVVDPNAEFEPGMVAQLTVFGNQQVCGVSDGSAPLGIIDDIKINAFSANSIDEVIIAPVSSPSLVNGSLVTPIDIKMELENPVVTPGSFVSDPVSVQLIPRNGVIVFPAGTVLNFDMNGDGVPDSIRTVVRYSYQIPNVPGDDSTFASGKVTVWFQRMIGAVDKYESNVRYPINAPLFVSEAGLLTTRQVDPDFPAIAMVTAPPHGINDFLEFLWL